MFLPPPAIFCAFLLIFTSFFVEVFLSPSEHFYCFILLFYRRMLSHISACPSHKISPPRQMGKADDLIKILLVITDPGCANNYASQQDHCQNSGCRNGLSGLGGSSGGCNRARLLCGALRRSRLTGLVEGVLLRIHLRNRKRRAGSYRKSNASPVPCSTSLGSRSEVRR